MTESWQSGVERWHTPALSMSGIAVACKVDGRQLRTRCGRESVCGSAIGEDNLADLCGSPQRQCSLVDYSSAPSVPQFG